MIASFAVLCGVLTGPAATSSPPGQATTLGPLRMDGQQTAVTLVTGDRVLIGPSTEERPAITVIPANDPGREVVTFDIEQVAGDVYVLPSDVAPLIGGMLDRSLFNVTRLIEDGYDDARASSLPLIVQHSTAARIQRSDTAGMQPVRALPSVQATAVRAPRARAAELGSALDRPGRGPLAGVTRIWLDHKVHATELDPNLTQIGAPEAWGAGFDGDGVTVAVLDTGIDASHPDLAGKVVDEVDFTGSADAGDRVGHGTHVAATVAGSGAASDGARQGVAFGADLLNVKVLDDEGVGLASQIIAGMEWAAAHDARIANLSLGGGFTDGSDVLSQAVDALTASSGMLFVIAAGNDGPGESTVTAPGAAGAALTVAAVDANDVLAPFSGRGPRAGDLAMKPDITAPGVGIIAARAAGTSLGEPVDDLYTTLSGTSMATPHVAGAAAILAERHPDWSAARIKAMLEVTATALPGLSVYQQGGGRLDLSNALAAQVSTDTNNLDFGVSDAGSAGTSSKDVTLMNTGVSTATVNLAAAITGPGGTAAPAGTVTASPAQLVLDPGESGSVTVTVDPGGLAVGEYSGALTATPDGSGIGLRVPIGLVRDTPHVQLTIHLRDDGAPASGFVRLFNVEDATRSTGPASMPVDGDVSMRVVAGHYAVAGQVLRRGDDGSIETSFSVFNDQIDVTEDTEITLDATSASPIQATVAGDDTKIDNVVANYLRTDAKGNWWQSYPLGALNNPSLLTPGQVQIGQIGTATIGTVGTYTQLRLIPADAPHSGASPHAYDAVFRSPRFPNPADYHLSSGEVARFARVDRQFRALGDADPGRYFEARAPIPIEAFARVSIATRLQVPLHRVDYVDPDPEVSWQQNVIRHSDANKVEYTDPVVTYRPDEHQVETWFGAPLRPAGLAVRNADSMLVEAGGEWLQLDPPSERVGDLLDTVNRQLQQGLASSAQDLRLYRNGQLLANSPNGRQPLILAPVDPAPARYRIERTIGPIAQFPLSVSSRTVWELTSSAPVSTPVDILPLLQVEYSIPLDLTNRASAQRLLPVDLRVRPTVGAAASPVRTVRAWVSADDGASWDSVPVHRQGEGRFRAVVRPGDLPSGATMSLRVSASDAADGTVEQTIIRAFGVRDDG
ncbi:S8 family peptidase [Jiangella muralis]|uniref:S8 family peptidase n=1 Tax=Jiangella muralis TaxID=702383 RepID=UPI0012FB29D6|nr:S8 family serine peptidase [Jiangella muralis]